MYDMRSEAKEFVGESLADARAKAVSFFGLDESEITFRELSQVSGVGSRTVIVAQPTGMVGRVAGDGGGGRGRSAERDTRGRDRDTRGRDRDTRGRDRETRGRDRESRARDRETRGRDRERAGRGRGERDEEPRPARSEPSVGTAKGDLGPVGQFVLGVVERMDLGPFEVTETEEGRFLVYELAGPAIEELTEADGRATEAIQLLANQAAGRLNDDPKRVVVDAEGDRERREEFLGRMAERAARRARETGRSVALDPMNARDRRGIHMALRETEGIATMSVGEGRYRQAVVVPEGAAEYEEALSGSRNSSSNQEEDQA